MKKTIIHYDLIGKWEQGIEKHPQTDVEDMGMIVHKFRGETIGDCVFMLVSNLPDKLPDYIRINTTYKF